MYKPDISPATPCLGHRVSPSRQFLSFGVQPHLGRGLCISLNLKRRAAAFNLIEVTVATAIVGIFIVAIYSAINSSISMVKSCEENQNVTAILTEKLDTIRLYNWIQITNTAGFLPRNFTVGVDPLQTNSAAYYTGTISVAQAPISEAYRSNLLEVTVSVNWVSGSRPQSRSMTTYVSKYGLQSYIMR